MDHGSKGLSQERAYVTGLVAANAVCDTLGQGAQAKIFQVEDDEAHLALGKFIAKQTKGLAPPNLIQLFNRY